MQETITILQGTDGIRGRVAAEPAEQDICPLEYYRTSRLLTPAFFERYAYAYASLLIDRFQAGPGDWIVVGWDPRDREGRFTGAAIRGLRKAGLFVLQIGILPTPAVPLYMLQANAVGGMVLTASHNPADQNGIKLFHGYTALKFLPGDDALLSRTLFEQKELDLSALPITGELSDHCDSARKVFVDFCLRPENSWAEEADFSDTILVVDASKGAVASVVREIFARFRFRRLLFTNMEGDINESCGVADIEGRKTIAASEVCAVDAPFRDYDTLTTLFDLAGSLPEVKVGTVRLTALVFDGDGDRCYRLDYSPTGHLLIVSSGDLLGFHQAHYLADARSVAKTSIRSNTATSPLFVHTVESDLNVATAVRDLEYSPVLTGVGDKWILLRAVVDMIRSRIEGVEPQRSALHDCLRQVVGDERPSGFELSLLWRQFLESRPQEGKPLPGTFRIGIEKSGHCITPGLLATETETLPFFAGNGIKTGLNSLAAMRRIFREDPAAQWEQKLREPFPTGISATRYVYYVDRERIAPGNPFRGRFVAHLESALQRELPDSCTSEPVRFPEESAMIYYNILQNGKPAGAVFVRNSGTEDKAAVYLRGKKELLPQLQKIGEEAFLHLLKGMKSSTSEFARLEAEILQAVRSKRAIGPLAEKYAHLPFRRVMGEMERKGRLLERRGDGWRLTDAGAALMEELE